MQPRPSAPGASVNLSTRRRFQWATSQKTRAHSQNRKEKGTGYWLCSTPKWALWFSALSHQLSEQCAANKKHFINIPSDRSPLPVNIVPRRALVVAKMHSGSGSANRLLPAAHETVWSKWNATGHVTSLTNTPFPSFISLSWCSLAVLVQFELYCFNDEYSSIFDSPLTFMQKTQMDDILYHGHIFRVITLLSLFRKNEVGANEHFKCNLVFE